LCTVLSFVQREQVKRVSKRRLLALSFT